MKYKFVCLFCFSTKNIYRCVDWSGLKFGTFSLATGTVQMFDSWCSRDKLDAFPVWTETSMLGLFETF